jgi:hypothetical protein
MHQVPDPGSGTQGTDALAPPRPAQPKDDLSGRPPWQAPDGSLAPDFAKFVQAGVSICVGACERGRDPVAGLGLACRLSGDGRLRLMLRRRGNERLLASVADGSPVAVTFTQPDHAPLDPAEGVERRARRARARGRAAPGAPAPRASRRTRGDRLLEHARDNLSRLRRRRARNHRLRAGGGLRPDPRPRSWKPPAMSLVTLDVIRNCLEGFLPSVLASCDEAGTPMSR